MAIIEEYKIGNTTIKIADDAIKKSPEEIEAILSRIVNIALPYLRKLEQENEDKNT